MSSAVKVALLGSRGTVGLELEQRLRDGLPGVLAVRLDKDKWGRDDLDGVSALVLCVPDDVANDAAKRALGWFPSLRVLDCSSANRVCPGWAYGLPELPGGSDRIMAAKTVANPGCMASGAVLMVAPLTAGMIVRPGSRVSFACEAGFSAGGRRMVENPPKRPLLFALNGGHRHVPEIRAFAGVEPGLALTVGCFYRGMSVQTEVLARRDDVMEAWIGAYGTTGLVRVSNETPNVLEVGEEGDGMTLRAYERGPGATLCVASYDNLGKGAAGAALQNLRLMLGL